MTATPVTTRAGLFMAGVTLTHGDGDSTVTALDDVSLTVEPGELLAVVGPSGAGKSSLLAVAGGLTRPDSGEVSVGEADLVAATPRRLAAIRRTQIGFVFQSGNLLPALTAIDQLRLPLHLGAVADPRDPMELLEEVGMAERATRRPHQLSGGERQRVGIARALMTRPRLLLVDEPTAALDRARSQEVVALLAREAHQHGVATVMVTHDHDVLHHCDRVLEMMDGRLLPHTD
ncbi:MAG: ABC transporter ATP-binding protein [Cellulomonas sp.]|uniref:ABC transporter ATP-binding protein n=1 Tax=Cellulomonas gelida TaxID=1712 RepID=A0A4Y3KR99_9CELL|nr:MULTISPECIES: ABC transporter ATP-binding protein [Cellulomonas]MCR6648993.1 ABC transporter ATP-binding protein [Cellulomonas sp.]MCR6704982.1 ABC transporter ATP-binding protein [Cellulomonas sp.]GEA85705.1 ABC transporter ATP-binding protein [Cellulomonas gelida]GGL39076.1 ABC transporter ATP-binding protein [Cellulomonas gelida]